MDPQTQLVLILAGVGVLVFWGLRRLLGGGGPSRAEELERRLSGKGADPAHPAAALSGADADAPAVGKRLMDKLARIAPLEFGGEDASQIAVKLAQAGVRDPHAPTVFILGQLALLVLGIIGGGLYGVFVGEWQTQNCIGAATGAGAILFFVPKVFLNQAASARILAITNGLPDALDLMVVSVEAGLGLDAAIQRVSTDLGKVYPALADEWQLAHKETQMGQTRITSLQNMAARSGCRDMISLVAILAQTERFGSSIAKALRTHSATMRVKRRQRAEEAAAKTAVKLIFPLALFIFPGIMFVVLGPILHTLLKSFEGMRGG